MTPYEVFVCYHNMKLHFTNPRFSYVKTPKGVRGIPTVWAKQSDKVKSLVDRFSENLQESEVKAFFLSNFVYFVNRESMSHITYFIENEARSYEFFEKWKKKVKNFSGVVRDDISKNPELFHGINTDMGMMIPRDEFSKINVDKLMKKVLQGIVTKETYIVMMYKLGWEQYFDFELIEWEHDRIKKYSEFISLQMIETVYNKIVI